MEIPTSQAERSDAGIVTVRIPVAFRKRGGRKVVISPEGQSAPTSARPQVDNTLLRALIQAFHWQQRLDRGHYATVSELAAAEKLNGSYVAHVLRLTLLSPEIVEAILEGRQPMTMQLQPLMRQLDLYWSLQKARFV